MVLRSKSVGEQDVADQRGAFFCAEGPPGPALCVGRDRAGPFALGAPAPLRLFARPPSCVQAVEAPRAPCGRRGGSVY